MISPLCNISIKNEMKILPVIKRKNFKRLWEMPLFMYSKGL